LKLSIARTAADMRGFHFGNIREIERGTVAEYALHIQCPWRIENSTDIITGSRDFYHWAFDNYKPMGWDYYDGNNLQDVRLGELLQGYDAQTQSLVNITESLVVERVEASPFGDAVLYLSGGYRLVLFPDSANTESWRLFKAQNLESHFVVDQGYFGVGYPTPSPDAQGPQRAAFFYKQGEAYRVAGDLPQALEALTQAIEINPEMTPAYWERAGLYRSRGDLEKAAADLDRAIELNPRFYDAYCHRGNLRVWQGDLDRGLADFEQAIFIHPDWGVAYLERGAARNLKKDLDGAAADFTEFIHHRRNNAEGYDRRGDIYYQQDRYDEAIADFTEAIRQKPGEWVYYYDRGFAYADKGDTQSAIQDFQKALTFQADDLTDAIREEMTEYLKSHLDGH
jgi:tetratricopeptide (TPR) repeat protein